MSPAQSLDGVAQLDVLPGWETRNGTHMAGLRITLAPGWKTYWRAAGDAGIDHGAVIRAVAGGLHNHVAGKAQVVAQRKQLILGRIAGRVLALGCKRELDARAKHMAMGVYAAGG